MEKLNDWRSESEQELSRRLNNFWLNSFWPDTGAFREHGHEHVQLGTTDISHSPNKLGKRAMPSLRLEVIEGIDATTIRLDNDELAIGGLKTFINGPAALVEIHGSEVDTPLLGRRASLRVLMDPLLNQVICQAKLARFWNTDVVLEGINTPKEERRELSKRILDHIVTFHDEVTDVARQGAPRIAPNNLDRFIGIQPEI